MNEQLLKTSGADVLSPRKNSGKPYGETSTAAPPPALYVRALSHNFILTLIRKLSLRVSFFPVSLLAKSATSTPKIKRQASYPCHIGVFPPSLPSPPTHLIIIVDVTELVLPLLGEGILPVMAYRGRPCPKGVHFSGFRYMKG